MSLGNSRLSHARRQRHKLNKMCKQCGVLICDENRGGYCKEHVKQPMAPHKFRKYYLKDHFIAMKKAGG